jgi:hypothetical protein
MLKSLTFLLSPKTFQPSHGESVLFGLVQCVPNFLGLIHPKKGSAGRDYNMGPFCFQDDDNALCIIKL